MVTAALMTLISDNFWYIASSAAAGVLADIAAWRSRGVSRTRQARILSFALPALWYGSYLVAVAIVEGGLGWSIHLILGAPLIAGAAGFLLSLVVLSAWPRSPSTA